MENICRPIVLYNNFLPPVGEKFSWEYCAFGTFDGIDIKPAITGKDANELLAAEWEDNLKSAQGLEGKYTVQTIYGFCYKDIVEENAFWESEYPYTFFSRIQLRWSENSIKRDVLEKILNSVDGIMANVYYALDHTDFIVVLKAQNYSGGAGVVHSMHRVLPGIMNSHSVFALKQDWIDECVKNDRKIEEENITRVDLRIIEKSPLETEGWQSEFENEMSKFRIDIEKPDILHIIGTDDVIVTMQNVEWCQFFKFYQTKGLLTNAYEFYQRTFAGVTTTIVTETVDYAEKLKESFVEFGVVDEKNVEKDLKVQEIYQCIVGRLHKKINALKEKYKSDGELNFKELYMIINALPKYSEEVFSDYTFFAIIKPLEALLDLMPEWSVDDNYYEFIKSFLTYIQNPVKSDRLTMQMIDFNTRIYDFPSKICAFYTAYMYEVGKVLSQNDEQKPYDFMVIPGATKIVNIKEVFRSATSKRTLMRVEIPEHKFFDVEGMLVILTHEVAHYVGSQLRNRADRKKVVLRTMARGYVGYIKNCLLYESYIVEDEDTTELWDYCVDRTYYALDKLIKRNNDIVYLENKLLELDDEKRLNIKENSEQRGDYFILLEQYVKEAFIDITKGVIDPIFGVIINHYKDEHSGIRAKITEYSERFIVDIPGKTTIMNMHTLWQQVRHLYEESFADLMSVLILGLDINQYLDYMIKENKKQGSDFKEVHSTDALLRVTIISNIIFDDEAEKKVVFSKKISEEQKLIAKKMRSIIVNKKQNSRQGLGMLVDKMAPQDYIQCCAYGIMYAGTYEEVFKYLRTCKADFVKVARDTEKIKYFFDMYTTSSSENIGTNAWNIEDVILSIQKIVNQYKTDLYQELLENMDK